MVTASYEYTWRPLLATVVYRLPLRTMLNIGSNHLISQTGWNRCNLTLSLSLFPGHATFYRNNTLPVACLQVTFAWQGCNMGEADELANFQFHTSACYTVSIYTLTPLLTCCSHGLLHRCVGFAK